MVGQVGALGDTVVEVEVHAAALGGGPQPPVHVGVGFDGDERGPGGQVAEVGTHSGAELDDLVGQLGRRRAACAAQVPLQVRAHQAEEHGVEAATRAVYFEPGRVVTWRWRNRSQKVLTSVVGRSSTVRRSGRPCQAWNYPIRRRDLQGRSRCAMYQAAI